MIKKAYLITLLSVFCLLPSAWGAETINSYDDVLMIYDEQGQQAAIKALIQLANNNDAEGQYQLGQRYLLGDDIAQNFNQALSWLQAAAEQAYVPAMKVLSELYASGLGVAIDSDKAIFWLEKAENLTKARAKAANEVLSSDCD